MGFIVGSLLYKHPHAGVQGIKIWRAGGPHILVPEGHKTVLHPLPGLLRSVGRGPVLLEDIVGVRRVVGLDPGLDRLFQDVNVHLSVELEALFNEDRGHFLTI